jgi:hypothetical protein
VPILNAAGRNNCSALETEYVQQGDTSSGVASAWQTSLSQANSSSNACVVDIDALHGHPRSCPCWQILPLENARGRDLVEAGKLCERKNGRGVDTNRNWEVDWGRKEKDYDPNEEYPGTAPFSEPEVRVILDVAKALRPHVWLNVHSGMEAMFTPWDHRAEVRPDAAAPELRFARAGSCACWCCHAKGCQHVLHRLIGKATLPAACCWMPVGASRCCRGTQDAADNKERPVHTELCGGVRRQISWVSAASQCDLGCLQHQDLVEPLVHVDRQYRRVSAGWMSTLSAVGAVCC